MNYNLRLTGTYPRVLVDDSNLHLQLNHANSNVSLTKLHIATSNNSLQLIQNAVGTSWLNATCNLVIGARGQQVADIHSDGMFVSVLTADIYNNLLDTKSSTSISIPPTANALSEAFITLSNMITLGNNVSNNSSNSNFALIDDYTSTSVTTPPTANAVRAAYYNLSNLLAVKLRTLGTASQDSNFGVSGSNQLDNDMWLLSTPDETPRFYFENNSHTVFGASTNPLDGYIFKWYWNNNAEDVMRIKSGKHLEVLGSAMVLTHFSACNSSEFASDLRVRPGAKILLGSTSQNAVISFDNSNIGVNLPDGAPPLFAFHVNGSIGVTDRVLTLSDRNMKTDIEPLKDCLQKLHNINGCTFRFKDDVQHTTHMGVIAQDVKHVAPEVVHTDTTTGHLSVAYGNLIAMVVEAVKELASEITHIRQDLATLKSEISHRL